MRPLLISIFFLTTTITQIFVAFPAAAAAAAVQWQQQWSRRRFCCCCAFHYSFAGKNNDNNTLLFSRQQQQQQQQQQQEQNKPFRLRPHHNVRKTLPPPPPPPGRGTTKSVDNNNVLFYSKGRSSSSVEDLYGAIHRKEHEMALFKKDHQGLNDPIQVAMGYVEESIPPLKLAKALRRVYEDEDYDDDDPNWQENMKEMRKQKPKQKQKQTAMSIRRGCFVADIKRKSLSAPGETFARFDDAGIVAEAMVNMGADCVFINIDYTSYGGDITELQNAVRAVRKVNPKSAIVMKDIVVDEIQIGIAKEAGVDGILLIASILGPALPNFLDLCTIVGLESIVEVHTKNEIQVALNAMAQNLLVSNFDRISGIYYPNQAERLAGMFPGSGGPIVALATGGIQTPKQAREVLCAGYDGVVVGRGIMGSSTAAQFIKEVRDRPLLPAEFAGWGLDDVHVDMEGTFTTLDEK